MSNCVIIKTSKKIKPEDLFKDVSAGEMSIMVVSTEFPTLKLGAQDGAIRGVEVNLDDEGYEVRVCTFAGMDDYRLFCRVIDSMVNLTGGEAYFEGDEKIGGKAADFFTEEWIQQQMDSDLNVVRALVYNKAQPVIMPGFSMDIVAGPRFFENAGIPLMGDYDIEDATQMRGFLSTLQCGMIDWENTSPGFVLKSGTEKGRQLTISAIVIKNNKVKPFKYVSNADAFAIIDMDNDDMTVIPMSQAHKLLDREQFEPIDDHQYIAKEDISVETARRMLHVAHILEPDDIFKRPVIPGFGYDEEQRTFILMWNPAISSMTLDAFNSYVPHLLTTEFNWSIWEHEQVRVGDRFFLVRCGEGHTGIVMSGIIESKPYEGEDWSGKGRRTFYADLHPTVILNSESAPMVSTSKLQASIPDFEWTRGHSGRLLTTTQAEKIERLWSDFVAKTAPSPVILISPRPDNPNY